MTHKFECQNCKHTFEADDNKEVLCPKCQSDNVEYYTKHRPYGKILIVGLSVLTVCSIIYLATQFFSAKQEDKQVLNSDVAEDTSSVMQKVETEKAYEQETGLHVPPTIMPIGEKQLADDQTYSFEVAVEHAPSVDFKVVLLEKGTNKVVAESKNGKFTNIPASKAEGGMYIIKIEDCKTGKELCDPQPIDGFIPIQKVSHRLSVGQVQELLDKEDETLIGDGENPYLAPGYKIEFKGVKDNDELPTNLADVIEKVYMGVWKSVKVEALEYDKTMHISCIKLIVKK